MKNEYRFFANTILLGIPMPTTITCRGYRLAKMIHAQFMADGMYFDVTGIVKVVRNS